VYEPGEKAEDAVVSCTSCRGGAFFSHFILSGASTTLETTLASSQTFFHWASRAHPRTIQSSWKWKKRGLQGPVFERKGREKSLMRSAVTFLNQESALNLIITSLIIFLWRLLLLSFLG